MPDGLTVLTGGDEVGTAAEEQGALDGGDGWTDTVSIDGMYGGPGVDA